MLLMGSKPKDFLSCLGMVSLCLACRAWSLIQMQSTLERCSARLDWQHCSGRPYRWMLVGHDGSGEPWNIWKTLATRNLATLLVSDVWKEDTTKVSINGARKRTFSLGEKCQDSNAYTKICQAADWILVKQDTEARHEVLVRRLSAIVRDSDSNGVPEWLTVLPESLQEALDGARLDHRAYVRSKSAETVKAMADLRKAVGRCFAYRRAHS